MWQQHSTFEPNPTIYVLFYAQPKQMTKLDMINNINPNQTRFELAFSKLNSNQYDHNIQSFAFILS